MQQFINPLAIAKRLEAFKAYLHVFEVSIF